jgi:hypothetical protein
LVLPGPNPPKVANRATMALPWVAKVEELDGKRGDTHKRSVYLGTFAVEGGQTIRVCLDFVESCTERSRDVYRLQHPVPSTCCGRLCARLEELHSESGPIGGGLGVGTIGGRGLLTRPELIFRASAGRLECAGVNSAGSTYFGEDAEAESCRLVGKTFAKGQ